MKKSLVHGAFALSAAVLSLGCFGNHVHASTAVDSAHCSGLGAQDKELGYAALNAGTWLGPAHAMSHHGRVVHKRAVGVVLYVHAKPGLSAPWLRRAAECRIAEESRSGNASSPFGVADTYVEVVNAKHGYLVRITAQDSEAVEQLVQRAGG